MERTPAEIAERIVTAWLMRADPIQGTAEQVGEYLGIVYARVLQAVKAEPLVHHNRVRAEDLLPFVPDARE